MRTLVLALALTACDAAAWQEAAKSTNDAQFGSSSGGPRARTCGNDRDCYQDEACVQQGRQGVCARRN